MTDLSAPLPTTAPPTSNATKAVDDAAKKLSTLLGGIFGYIMLALAAVVTVETLGRKLFNFSLQGADELGGYALAVG